MPPSASTQKRWDSSPSSLRSQYWVSSIGTALSVNTQSRCSVLGSCYSLLARHRGRVPRASEAG